LFKGAAVPYVEVGNAGVLKVPIKYEFWKEIPALANGLAKPIVVYPGYLFGASGILDALLDLTRTGKFPRYTQLIEIYHRMITQLFMFKPADVAHRSLIREASKGTYVPGEGLYSIG